MSSYTPWRSERCQRRVFVSTYDPFKAQARRKDRHGKKTGRGEGTIRQRKDGRWEARIDLDRGTDGKRRRKSAFADTQAGAVKLLKRLAGRAVDGQLLTTSTPTVAAYLEDWLPPTATRGGQARRGVTEARSTCISRQHLDRFDWSNSRHKSSSRGWWSTRPLRAPGAVSRSHTQCSDPPWPTRNASSLWPSTPQRSSRCQRHQRVRSHRWTSHRLAPSWALPASIGSAPFRGRTGVRPAAR